MTPTPSLFDGSGVQKKFKVGKLQTSFQTKRDTNSKFGLSWRRCQEKTSNKNRASEASEKKIHKTTNDPCRKTLPPGVNNFFPKRAPEARKKQKTKKGLRRKNS